MLFYRPLVFRVVRTRNPIVHFVHPLRPAHPWLFRQSACAVGGVNCLRLIHEHTATALAYGIYKSAKGEFHEKVWRVEWSETGAFCCETVPIAMNITRIWVAGAIVLSALVPFLRSDYLYGKNCLCILFKHGNVLSIFSYVLPFPVRCLPHCIRVFSVIYVVSVWRSFLLCRSPSLCCFWTWGTRASAPPSSLLCR